MNNEKVKFLLNWNHFGEHLSSCMTKLMTDTSYSDIIISTADKRMIYSHRFVLANSSKYFQRLFKHVSGQRGIQLVVALPEVKYEIFKILMNYMYKGETQVPHELLPSVIKAGQFLEINGLVNLSENEGSGGGSTNKNSGRDHSKSCPVSGSDGKQLKRTSTLRDNVRPRENTPRSLLVQKTKRPSVNCSDDGISKSTTVEESGKENLSKSQRTVRCRSLPKENKEATPLKRKNFGKESAKKTSPVPSPSVSVPNESCPPRKIQKRHSSQEMVEVNIREDRERSKSPAPENEQQENEELEENITIKMEVPDEIEEIVYNELQCEFCHEMYTNPSDWVKHMTDQHGDRGFQTYRDLDKTVGGNSVMTCVVCSSVCFSAAEWAKHLRMWHTEGELALANLAENKKSNTKVRKNQGFTRRGRSCKK